MLDYLREAKINATFLVVGTSTYCFQPPFRLSIWLVIKFLFTRGTINISRLLPTKRLSPNLVTPARLLKCVPTGSCVVDAHLATWDIIGVCVPPTLDPNSTFVAHELVSSQPLADSSGIRCISGQLVFPRYTTTSAVPSVPWQTYGPSTGPFTPDLITYRTLTYFYPRESSKPFRSPRLHFNS